MKLNPKLKSRKFWIALWAIAMVSFVVITNRTEAYPLAEILALVPLAYSGLNVWQKVKGENNRLDEQ